MRVRRSDASTRHIAGSIWNRMTMDKGKAMYAATQSSSYQLPVEPAPRPLLIVEDDKAFLARLSRAMATRGFTVTGCGNVATAVTAVKLGAVDYLAKPADADEVAAALLAVGGAKSELPQNPMSADRVRWEHIQRIYEMCDRNVSETARRLNMHRRTLQRILAKRAPR